MLLLLYVQVFKKRLSRGQMAHKQFTAPVTALLGYRQTILGVPVTGSHKVDTPPAVDSRPVPISGCFPSL